MTGDPWKTQSMLGGYIGLYLPEGQRTWRFLKSKGKPKIFPNPTAALSAARERWFELFRGHITATTEKAMREALGVEDWLKSNHSDHVEARTVKQRGRTKRVVVMRGRA